MFHHEQYQAGAGIEFRIAPDLSFGQVIERSNPGTYAESHFGPKIPEKLLLPFALDKPEQAFSSRAGEWMDRDREMGGLLSRLAQTKETTWLPVLQAMAAEDRRLEVLVVKDLKVADFPLRRFAAQTIAEIIGRPAEYTGLGGEKIDSRQMPQRPYADQDKLVARLIADGIAHDLTGSVPVGAYANEYDGRLQERVERAASQFGANLPALVQAELKRRGLDTRLRRLPTERNGGEWDLDLAKDSIFAAVCQADRTAETAQDGSSDFKSKQPFKVIHVLRGQAPAGGRMTLRYFFPRGQWTGEREIAKGERVIWTVIGQDKSNPSEWRAYHAVPDTPENRRLVEAETDSE